MEKSIVKNTQKAIRKYNLSSVGETIKMANVLKKHIIDNKLFVLIKEKNYVFVEGWQFAGGLLGIRPLVVKEKDLSNDKEIKWKVTAELIEFKTDKIVGRGVAICSNKEEKKKFFDEYAILSMAQTRAIGKAYRNLLGWVMKMAGYESTPAEEMKSGNGEKANVAMSVMDVNKKIDTIDTKDKAEKMEAWLDKNEMEYTPSQSNVMRRRLEEQVKTLKK